MNMTRKIKEKRFESLTILALVIVSGIVFFNHLQIIEIKSSLKSFALSQDTSKISKVVSSIDLSGTDVSKISSTAMTIATVFPELKNANSEEEVIEIIFPSGTPEYSEKLGGITFDDITNSLNYLARWYYSLKEEVKNNDPETWQRYLNLAAAPRGISCEFCCGIGPQGIDAQGNLRCGCQHNPALQALTLALMKYTNYSDAEILREVMKWKTAFYPKGMISLAVQVAGKDISEIKNLPGMVGGC